ncbi:MAG: hypothetical protein A3D31_10710 [Candidatus Fluviicola riflensis]|nr:MAG: hypothetical protein CHH17_15130 [Candidatus Fluviicola riflensis]OGS78526.1 MAG: hypothetical protein A3D31_10710 [Candidatus Fluviicola riflensis]OGS84392.1 MAG: hypothetical protein A3E30_12110 [Fluviicola sp. RIFCSPHIGHO2_12_FULL_43_24]OGS85581.1 MAG: hypothetical protein A2724_07650 [Fluviicola sp. RIFCSPHIGHO2_01_FULL_43_53]
MRMPLFVYRIFVYEYWPAWIFYLPVLPYWLYLSLRLRSFSFFTAANPGIEMGGFFGESKNDILARIDGAYLPKHVLVSSNDVPDLDTLITEHGLCFPLIAKPDVGERGSSVTKISSRSELGPYIETLEGASFILQEFIAYEEEFGVFYSRLPNETSGCITSLTRKVFLSVTGDGHSTIAQLMQQSVRARFQLPRFLDEMPELMQRIPASGELCLLEPIGNHCRGTEFVNAEELITSELTLLFDEISRPIDGFFYGRFDIKVESIEQLKRGEAVKIMELNGISSEPGHIYDTRMNLLKAWYDVTRHWKRLAAISKQNLRSGTKQVRFSEIASTYVRHVWRGRRV